MTIISGGGAPGGSPGGTPELAPMTKQQFFDTSGIALAAGQVQTYLAGTTTNASTYTDSSGTSANTNPVLLDGAGRANIWLDPTLAYKFVVMDSGSNIIYTTDNVGGSSGGGGTSITSITGAQGVTSVGSGTVTIGLGDISPTTVHSSGMIINDSLGLTIPGRTWGYWFSPVQANYAGMWSAAGTDLMFRIEGDDGVAFTANEQYSPFISTRHTAGVAVDGDRFASYTLNNYAPGNITGEVGSITQYGTVGINLNSGANAGAAPLGFNWGGMVLDGSNNLLVGNGTSATTFTNNGNIAINSQNGFLIINHPSTAPDGNTYLNFGYGTVSVGSISQLGTTGFKVNSEGVLALAGTTVTAPTPTTGDNSTQVATTAFVNASAGGLGYGQSWVVYTVGTDRSSAVNYLNSTGKPIQILVTPSGSSATGNYAMQVHIDGTQIMNNAFGGSTGTWHFPVAVIVPAGSYYMVTSGYDIQSWAELR